MIIIINLQGEFIHQQSLSFKNNFHWFLVESQTVFNTMGGWVSVSQANRPSRYFKHVKSTSSKMFCFGIRLKWITSWRIFVFLSRKILVDRSRMLKSSVRKFWFEYWSNKLNGQWWMECSLLNLDLIWFDF